MPPDSDNPFNAASAYLLTPQYRYQIRDTHTQTNVGKPYTSQTRASKRVDRLDNEYGAYRYCVVRVMVQVTP